MIPACSDDGWMFIPVGGISLPPFEPVIGCDLHLLRSLSERT